MRRLLFTIISFFYLFPLHAQWSGVNFLSLDSGDSLFSGLLVIDTAHYHHNIWQIGKPNKTVFTAAHSLPRAIVTDTLNPYPINDTSVFILKMPFSIPTLPGLPTPWAQEIQFNYQLRKDSGSIARLEISQDNGAHWHDINDTLLPGFFWQNPSDTDHFTDTTAGWRLFSLRSYPPYISLTDSFLFRFTFISDSVFANRDGWIIDDIILTYAAESVSRMQNEHSISVFPNPANTVVNIRSKDNITDVSILNLLGETLYNSKCYTQKLQIDVSNLPSGIYFFRLNRSEVWRFVKQ
jgi:hypothetical protein